MDMPVNIINIVLKHAYFRKFISDYILQYMFLDVLEAN